MATVPDTIEEVLWEQERQVEKFGVQNHPDGTGLPHHFWQAHNRRIECDYVTERGGLTWRHILDEEVAGAFAETDPDKLRTELIQVAAVAMSWVQAIDRREALE